MFFIGFIMAFVRLAHWILLVSENNNYVVVESHCEKTCLRLHDIVYPILYGRFAKCKVTKAKQALETACSNTI